MIRYVEQSLQAKLVLPVALGAVCVLGFMALVLLYNPSVTLALGLLALGTAGLTGLTTAISRRAVLQPLHEIFTTYDHLRIGNMQARVATSRHDELGALATDMNQLLDQLGQRLETAEYERDSMQEALQRLLMEVSEVARGNLTVEAMTTTAVTEALAAAFNSMIRQLRTVVAQVQDAVLQVSASAHEIQATAEHLAHGSSMQATQIVESSTALDEMTVSIHDVSEHATLSATVAEQALANAKQGARAVQNTIQGMQRIRTQVHETAIRSKQLGERSREISEIVQLIGDLADRTSVLALNASIEAALAGTAGQGFAIVAQEVERLAQRATAATRQIASLVASMQSETQEVVSALEESTHEVVQGSHLADQAGQALGEIETVSARLAELIQSISLAAKQQARGSENLSKAVVDISDITQHMAAGTQQAALSIQHLATLADELRHTVGIFKLPTPTHGHHVN